MGVLTKYVISVKQDGRLVDLIQTKGWQARYVYEKRLSSDMEFFVKACKREQCTEQSKPCVVEVNRNDSETSMCV